ncbi:DUF4886 domain-containing protein [Sphingobacterium sp. SGR-19]|uniref:DUF4886 domain-containing protein n=1 Tax=Sphingobacterium sp. SGR-19 TaxID=2710886 RepID=UPI0013EBFE66|nr:DUF4886 domain-containing protein [Sphingobacterium sp. SGR-19]NGM67185.1 DUF4886 domain-containing protein [Sphingobacterium sp. SGR-19]
MKRYRNFILILVLLSTVFGFAACEKETESRADIPEQFVALGDTIYKLVPGEELILTPQFDKNPLREYTWTVEKSDVVSLQENTDGSMTVIGIRNGTSSVTISSTDGIVIATCTVVVDDGSAVAAADGVIKILAIGNSFSEDALENYLYELAKEEGVPIVIGNLYIGGASLDLHLENATGNRAAYQYRKIGEGGVKTNTASVSIATAIADDDWDYISMQQASPNSGQYNTFTTPLPLLVDYVKKTTTNTKIKLIMHQTWAYAQNSTHEGFANYNKDQMTMYQAIVDAVGRAADLIEADMLIPAGTAIQNGRTSLIGDNFTRDGYHLDLSIGRYTAACTWFEMLTGKSPIGKLFKPQGLSDYEAEIAQHAAHYAVLNPHSVTQMTDYQDAGGSGISTTPVFVGFGFNNATAGWNGFMGANSYLEGETITNLKDANENYTGVSMTIVEGFNGRNANGEKSTTTDMNIPTEVSSYSYFGNSKAVFSGKTIVQSVLRVSGLDKTKKYNFCFFGTRSGVGAGDNREAKYIVKGENEIVSRLDASNNTTKTACSNAVQPDSNGEITITVTSGENNTNSTGFFYINAVRIVSAG